MMSPTAVLDRVTGGRGTKAIKYSMVSVVAVGCTQVLLVLCHGILAVEATTSNIIAVCLASIPAFVLNRRWVWGRTGPSHFTREVLPFWGFSLVGLLLSTLLVAIAQHWSDSTVLISGANITAFGMLWVAKFLLLDELMFGRERDAGVLLSDAA
jgi:putative flippase GtrA